jgi:hypothetical protein
MAQTEFERELEIFRTDEEAAQQAFFCWLSFRNLLASDKEVHRAVNVTPLFWRTTPRKQAIDLQAAILAALRKRNEGAVAGEGAPARWRLPGSSDPV